MLYNQADSEQKLTDEIRELIFSKQEGEVLGF